MSDPGLHEQIAPRRIHDGGITKSAGVYLDHGRPTPEYLTDVFDRLTWTEWTRIEDGDGIRGSRQVRLTEVGATRYAELSERDTAGRRQAPDPEFGPRITAPDSQSGTTS